jgi:L-fucose dehydrogenase
MDLGLSGKVVVVTGGASGIGAAVSEILAEEGAVPAILARSEPDPSFLDRLAVLSPKAGWIRADLSRDEEVARAAAEVRARWGRVDALVNNAGANDRVGLEAGPEAFRASLDQNLLHYYTLLHLLLPDLKAARGAVVNVSSKTAVTGQGGHLGLCRGQGGAARADAGMGGGACALGHPGERGGAGRGDDAALSPAARRAARPRSRGGADHGAHPLGHRMTTAREIAETVVFLLSDRASHTTGQWLFPDGGYTHLDRALG